MRSSRKANPQMGLVQKVGVSVTQNCRGRRELPAIRFMLLKGRLKGLSGRASGGSKTGTLKWSMAGGDFWIFSLFWVIQVCVLSCNPLASMKFDTLVI